VKGNGVTKIAKNETGKKYIDSALYILTGKHVTGLANSSKRTTRTTPMTTAAAAIIDML
jgi:hypothetical protein